MNHENSVTGDFAVSILILEFQLHQQFLLMKKVLSAGYFLDKKYTELNAM
jgi:hypothetical protein